MSSSKLEEISAVVGTNNAAARQPGCSGHVLVVDDDFMLRSMAAKTLRHAGFEVSEASSGEEGLERFFEDTAFDLVLLDVMMPGLDGFEVCQKLRASPRGARLPILLLTGLNDTESVDAAYASGATDFISKPINWTLLSYRVRYALRASVASEDMRRSRETLSRAQRLAGMGNWQLHPDGRLECSAELLSMFGNLTPPDELNEHELVNVFLAQVVDKHKDQLLRARLALLGEGKPYQMEYQITRPDGQIRTVFEQAEAALTDDAIEDAGVLIEGITQDTTERVDAQNRIRQLAHYDDVTGLPNRLFFSELATPVLERARRSRTHCAMLHVDIDRFKGINDAFGREQGDAVLKALAERFRSWIRSGDLVAPAASGEAGEGGEVGEVGEVGGQNLLARVGGNAFNLMIADLADQAQAAEVAQRLLASFEQPFALGDQSLLLSASIGISVFPGDANNLADLTRCAEQAVYSAKASGRAQHRFFDEKINALAASRLMKEAELRTAIAHGQLRLHFQPKVDASGLKIVGAEALVRWQHPQRGLVPPAEFIPMAEETGLILPMTDWVLEAACRALNSWRDAGLRSVPLSVNLAAPSLSDPTLISKLDALMNRFKLKPEMLMLEVTETILMTDVQQGTERLDALRAKGYGLSLDDFGTGYSSLSYLKRFPIDELKIDRSFVNGAERGGRDGALAAAIITLARDFGLSVVAEGVETPEQALFLIRHGCPVQQGFWFSKPVPSADFEVLLRDGLAASKAVIVVQEEPVDSYAI
jgi:predicted signal transduction protein with EAL and GGDEF domain/CheY-like chemotaxis protein